MEHPQKPRSETESAKGNAPPAGPGPASGGTQPHGASTPGQDEFRTRLKRLGYLENPLEKFFIGRAGSRTGVFTANLKVAIKVGILGGVFLGLVTAGGFALLSPQTFPTLFDLARLAAYFCLIFTVVFTCLELVICLAATLLGKIFRKLFTHTQMVALYSGIFAGLAVLFYATLWWWAESAEVGLFSAISLGAFLTIAIVAAGAAFLTRLAVTALLAVLAGPRLDAHGTGKGRATKLYLAILVCGVVIFAGYRMVTSHPAPKQASPFQKDDTGLSVTLVAVDGADIEFFDYLAGKGLLPNLSRLAKQGFTASLAPPQLHINPAVWTSVATGVCPHKHGVTAYSAQEIPGIGLYVGNKVGFGLYDALLSALPAVGLSRRSPLERRSVTYPHIWDIIALKGDLSGVVNWWGTWPANNFHGFLVTDRMYPKLLAARATGGDALFENETYPQALFNQLRGYPLDTARMADSPRTAAEDIDRFAVTALVTAGQDYHNISLKALYLPGLDIYTNVLYKSASEGADLAEQANAVEGATAYWRWLDGLLEPVISQRDHSHVVILAADPGMLKGPERRFGRTARGFVVISGGPAKRGRDDKPLAYVDIAGAVLYLLGFPLSREMDAHVPVKAFDEAFVGRNPVRSVKTYGRLVLTRPSGYSVNKELVERLRSLGYL